MLLAAGAGLLPAACGGGSHGAGMGGQGGGVLPGVGGAAGGSALGPCGLPDVEPNDTRDLATPYVLGSTVVACIGAANDVDVYSFTAPATDLAGGYVLLSLTDVGATGNVDVTLFSAADNSSIDEIYKTDDGASLFAYLAVAPGVTYRIQVNQFAGGNALYRYTMKGAYVPIADAYEPNDTKDTAKPIAVGTPIMASLSSGYVLDPYKGEAFADWYSVPLAVGAATIKLANMPTDISGDVQLFDPSGEKVDEMYTTTNGANVMLTTEVMTAGTYKLVVQPFAGGPRAADEAVAMVPPDHFTRLYTLTVTQP